jgi:hypothetical protein
LKDDLHPSPKTINGLDTRPGLSKPFFFLIIPFLLIVLPVLLYSLVGFATQSGQTTEPVPPVEFIQPIEFSHKIHVEKSEIPCEFCHIYARRSINSGVPPMANCYGCHKHNLIPGSDDKQKGAIKKLLELQPKAELIPWKKIYDVPDFVHFSHKRHILVGFDCTECHGEIHQHDVLSPQNMITDLSMGWCMKCHQEGRPAVGGKIAGPVRGTRGGKIVKQDGEKQPDGILVGPTDCYTCHK